MNTKLTALTCALTTAVASVFAADASTPAKEINSLGDIQAVGEALSKFSASATVGYESEYIFRGKQLAGAVVSPEVDISYDIGSGFGAYVGWWGCYSTDGAGYAENDLYAGATYAIENFTVDFGYTAYTYPSDGSVSENELKLSLSYDTSECLGDFAVSPYVSGFYNFTYSGRAFVFRADYEMALGRKLGHRRFVRVRRICRLLRRNVRRRRLRIRGLFGGRDRFGMRILELFRGTPLRLQQRFGRRIRRAFG